MGQVSHSLGPMSFTDSSCILLCVGSAAFVGRLRTGGPDCFLLSLGISLVFGSFYPLPAVWARGIGTVVTVASGVYSLRVLAKLAPLERVPRFLRPLSARLQMPRADSTTFKETYPCK